MKRERKEKMKIEIKKKKKKENAYFVRDEKGDWEGYVNYYCYYY